MLVGWLVYVLARPIFYLRDSFWCETVHDHWGAVKDGMPNVQMSRLIIYYFLSIYIGKYYTWWIFLMCITSWLRDLNVRIHSWQLWGLSPLWINMCFFRDPDTENDFGHVLQGCAALGFQTGRRISDIPCKDNAFLYCVLTYGYWPWILPLSQWWRLSPCCSH